MKAEIIKTIEPILSKGDRGGLIPEPGETGRGENKKTRENRGEGHNKTERRFCIRRSREMRGFHGEKSGAFPLNSAKAPSVAVPQKALCFFFI